MPKKQSPIDYAKHLRIAGKLIREKKRMMKRICEIEKQILINESMFDFSMQQLVLKGLVPSKKNSKRILRAGNRPFIASSKEYGSWEKMTAIEMKQQTPVRNLDRVKMVSIYFEFGDNRRRDLSNKVEGIMDALVLAGILTDDSWQVVPQLLVGGALGKEHVTVINILDADETD